MTSRRSLSAWEKRCISVFIGMLLPLLVAVVRNSMSMYTFTVQRMEEVDIQVPTKNSYSLIEGDNRIDFDAQEENDSDGDGPSFNPSEAPSMQPSSTPSNIPSANPSEALSDIDNGGDNNDNNDDNNDDDEWTWILVWNSWDRTRYVCGRALPPKSPFLLNVTISHTNTLGSSSRIRSNSNHSCVASVDSEGNMGLFSFVRTFALDPALPGLNGTKEEQSTIPPVTIRFKQEVDFPALTSEYKTYGVNDGRNRSCDVPCTYWGKFHFGIAFVTFEGTPFRIKAMSMEGSGYYKKDLKIDPLAHWKQEYYSTTSFESDIPLTYYSLPPGTTRDVLPSHPPVDFDKGIKGASFLARNCGSINHREALVEELIEAASKLTNSSKTGESFRIDSLSKCVHHAPFGFPNGTSKDSDKKVIMEKYLFHLAFENQNTDDYITEKLWGTLKSGTIPVYFGASNIRDRLPHPHSVIVVSDFAYENKQIGKHNINATALMDHLYKVANNRTLYDSYHVWRTTVPKKNPPREANGQNHNSSLLFMDPPFDPASIEGYYQQFLDMYEFTRTDFTCRMCRLGYALQYGLGWDHRLQKLRALKLPSYGDTLRAATNITSIPSSFHNRSTCFELQTERMVYPLREQWASDDASLKEADYYHCHGSSRHTNSRRVEAGGNKFLRRIWDHDGVTDMEITRRSEQPSSPEIQTITAAASESSTSSSFRLVTPFGNSNELIVVNRHTSYRVESEWRKKDWKRFATASNKKARKRILPFESEDRFWQDKGTLVWIQDHNSRIVLMLDEPNAILSPTTFSPVGTESNTSSKSYYRTLPLEVPGTIELSLPETIQTLRLRWIVEDIDDFHSVEGPDDVDGSYGKESYFSSFMVDDFFHPLEILPLHNHTNQSKTDQKS